MKLGLMMGGDMIAVAKDLGFYSIPVWADELAKKGAKETCRPLRDAGLEVHTIGAFGFNPLNPDTAEQEQQRKVLKKVIDLAADTGARDILINGGNYGKSFALGHAQNDSDAALDKAAAELAPFLKQAEKRGVYLTIEPFIQCAISTPERFLRLKEKVNSEHLMVTLDVCNFYTYATMWRPTELARHVCGMLRGHYRVAHAKDLRVEEGVHIHIAECPLGDGVTDWKTILTYVKQDLPMDGWFILEHCKTPEDAKYSLGNLLKAAKAAGANLELKSKPKAKAKA